MSRSTGQQDPWVVALQMMERELQREFLGSHPRETIEAAARESVAEFASQDVRITTFVPVLARRARRRLKEEEQRAS